MFIFIKLCSEMKFLKIMSFMFVLGSMSSLFKMYLVPQAKVDSEVDIIAIVTIAICTFSTMTNIANWYFARHYYNVSQNFKQIIKSHTDDLLYVEPVRVRSCWEKLISFEFVTAVFMLDELCLATVLIYDFKRILAGDTRIRQNEVKISLTFLLAIKNCLAIWSTVLLSRGVWTFRKTLRGFRKLLMNDWVLLVHVSLIVLCQASILTQFSVMMFFFWSSKVSKDWVH